MAVDSFRLPLAQAAAKDSFDDLPKKDQYAARYLAKALVRGVTHDPGIQSGIEMQFSGYDAARRYVPESIRRQVFSGKTHCERCGEPFGPKRKPTLQHLNGDSCKIDDLAAWCLPCNIDDYGNWALDTFTPSHRDEIIDAVTSIRPPNEYALHREPAEGKFAFHNALVEQAIEAMCSGHHVLVQSPTGSGKSSIVTRIASWALRERRGRPVLILTNRIETALSFCLEFEIAGFDHHDISYGDNPDPRAPPPRRTRSRKIERAMI